ncbi:MAG: zinc transporter ZntB [Gammaproteobacteria bacterium]|nr:zinc transporter ZntB [Gammaproteobacteria bacterium]
MINKGLIAAYQFDGQGGGKALDWSDIDNISTADKLCWIHLDYTSPDAENWLKEKSGLDDLVIAALLSDDPRPRSAAMKDGLLVILRGVNLNPGADPEDMVSIRLWINDRQIITTRRRKLLSVADVCDTIEQGIGPCSSGEFLASIASRLVERMSVVVQDIDDKTDLLEGQVLAEQSYQLRSDISKLRREAISLRRYLAPQREAMSRLFNERAEWLSDTDRLRLREAADNVMRYIEDLDAIRERAIVIQEELISHISEQMDKRMYVLSMVAAIFLPLGFFTGLLGVNLGGIPGADDKGSFFVFCGVLLAVVFLQVLLFRKMKWL